MTADRDSRSSSLLAKSSADADLDAGMVRLRDTLVELAGLPLEQLLDEVLERLVDGHPEDDVALVAVRLHEQ
jgi:hypothetical protein